MEAGTGGGQDEPDPQRGPGGAGGLVGLRGARERPGPGAMHGPPGNHLPRLGKETGPKCSCRHPHHILGQR